MNRPPLRIIAIGSVAALALVAGGSAAGAAIAGGPVDSGGVIHGCWTNAAINGTHVFVLQDAGTNCPKGTTAISWNQQGPAGPSGATGPAGATGPVGPAGAKGDTGPAGPAGPAGATGPAGPQGPPGPQGQAGADGSTVLNGTGAPADTLGNDGDFYLDTAADVLYGPKAGGGWPVNGTSLIGPAGAKGDTGPAGPQGPPGPAGSGENQACTTDGGAPGLVTPSVQSDNSVTFTCVAPSTDANCTHSDGVGQSYTDCNDLLGTYDLTTARDAGAAYFASATGETGFQGQQFSNFCGQGDSVAMPIFDSSGTQTGVIVWFYTGQPGVVITSSGLPSSGCTTTSTGTWN